MVVVERQHLQFPSRQDLQPRLPQPGEGDGQPAVIRGVSLAEAQEGRGGLGTRQRLGPQRQGLAKANASLTATFELGGAAADA